MSPKPLISLIDMKGAFILEGTRETQSGTVAEVHLIGALLGYCVPAANVRPFQMSDAIDPKESGNDPITMLAQEAVTVYSLDPGRVQRAADLMRQPRAVQMAHHNENDEQITPSLKNIIVKGSKGWYLTRRDFCQCPDHKNGYTCKHRIAAWMLRESTVRPLAVARNRKPAEILAELTA